jgi:hypothetical protein
MGLLDERCGFQFRSSSRTRIFVLWKDAGRAIPILKQAKAACPLTFHLRASTYLGGFPTLIGTLE